jgi:hypothetical protein
MHPTRLILGLMCLLAALTGCPRTPLPRAVYEGDVTRGDSVLTSGRGLIRIVHYVDQYARSHGRLPAELEPVLAAYSRAREQERDVWGNAVRYLVRGRDYELRSAGPDGVFSTADDIIVWGQLGRNIPCQAETRIG